MDMKLVAIGDSLTEGIGDDSYGGGFVPYLSRGLDEVCHFKSITTFSHGKSGNRTPEVCSRIKESQEIQTDIINADAITITVGANDLLKIVKENIFTGLSKETFLKARQEYIKEMENLYIEIRRYNPDRKSVM